MKLETIDDVLKLNTLVGIQDKAKADPQGKTMDLLVKRLTQCGIRDKVEEIINGGGSGPNYLTFTALEDDCTVTFKCCYESPASYKTIEVSTDKVTWIEKTSSYEGTELATLNEGESLYVRGDNSTYHNYDEDPEIDDDVYNSFFMSAGVKLSGNIMSLIQSEGFDELNRLEEESALARLFSNYNGEVINESTIDAKELLLPANELAEGCYRSMFNRCTGLTIAPKLPATTLAESCYESMFYGCTGLTIASKLPATTLANNCYDNMFYGCTSLTIAPELPATTLATNCYRGTFSGCTLINSITCLADSSSAEGLANFDYTSHWLDGVSETGTLYYAAGMHDVWFDNGLIPDNWTVQEYQP